MKATQLWLRNAEGKVWGPLPPNQILMMLERKLITGVTESSHDGRHYVPVDQEPLLTAALAKQGAAAAPTPRTSSGEHGVWRPTTGSFPAQGAPAAAATQPILTPVAAAPVAPVVGRAPTPMQPTPVVAGSHAMPVMAPPAPASVAPVAAAAPAPPPMPAKIIQAAPPAGRLEEHSPLKLYYLIAAAETQGKLVLGEGPTAVGIWFKAGTPHAVESAALGLGEYLVEQGVLQPAQLAHAAPAIKAAAGDVASGLFATGLLNPQTAFPLIQQHAQTVLQRGLLLDHGPFTFDPATTVPPSGFQLGQRWQLLSAAARRIDSLRLRTWLHGREQLIPRVAGSTSELQLTAQETRLLTHLDGARTLAGALGEAGAHAEVLLRLLLMLTEIDRVTWEGGAAAAPSGPAASASRPPTAARPAAPMAPAAVAAAMEAPPPSPKTAPGLAGAIAKAVRQNAEANPTPAAAPTAAKPATVPIAPKPVAKPAAPAPKPAAPAPKPMAPTAAKTGTPLKIGPGQGANVNLPALVKYLEDLRGKDLFARLKLERSRATVPMLKSNYFQLAKLYHPDTVPPDGPEEARKVKADILSLLNEANGILSDDAKRIDYLDELEAKEALGDVDVEAILGAEEDFQQAIMLARARKFAEALVLIEKCIKVNPKEGEFYAWRGYCRFFGSQDKRTFRDMAIEDQKKALSLNAKCVPAWLFQGQIWKLLEDVPKAKDAFNKTLELDPNNIEAQRELRLFEQRKK